MCNHISNTKLASVLQFPISPSSLPSLVSSLRSSFETHNLISLYLSFFLPDPSWLLSSLSLSLSDFFLQLKTKCTTNSLTKTLNISTKSSALLPTTCSSSTVLSLSFFNTSRLFFFFLEVFQQFAPQCARAASRKMKMVRK